MNRPLEAGSLWLPGLTSLPGHNSALNIDALRPANVHREVAMSSTDSWVEWSCDPTDQSASTNPAIKSPGSAGGER
jgi:hypothetical protein